MLRTLRLLAIPATMFVAGSAIAGPYDAYKPPAVPPMSNIDLPTRTASIDTETTAVDTVDVADVQMQDTAAIDGVQVAQNEAMAPGSVVPPAPTPANGAIIMDNSATTTVVQPQTYQQPVYRSSGSTQNALPPRTQPFKRMMELERRKNAWLRKTFLNR